MDNAKKHHADEDLKLFTKDILSDLQIRFESVRRKYKMSYESVRDYLQAENPELVESVRLAEEGIDNDIYGRISDGKATQNDCDEWKRGLRHWRDLVVTSLNVFEESYALLDVA